MFHAKHFLERTVLKKMLQNLFRTVRKDGRCKYERIYTIHTFPYSRLSHDTVCQEGKKNPIEYISLPGAFDIETTSYHDGERIRGFMYVWQMCVQGYCVGGRTWEEWIEFLRILRGLFGTYDKKRLVIYVHNLGFEFQFIRSLLGQYAPITVFAAQKRKPMKATWQGIEFRCSFKLTNMSLARALENEYGCPYLKAVGDLDYKVYRDPYTILTDIEHTYCFMDVLGLYHFIINRLANEGDNLATIPLTSTGYVRRDCRKACKASRPYMAVYKRQSLNERVYTLLKEAGRGGDTAANRYLSGKEVADVDSYDVASSYPYQMLTQKFPSRKFYPYGRVETEAELRNLCKDTPVLARLEFDGLRLKRNEYHAYLSFSKATSFDGAHKIANGRVLSANHIAYTLTDIDWSIVDDCYEWDGLKVGDVYTSRYDYLPEELRGVILEYFRQKCVLKEKLNELEQAGLEETEEYVNITYLYAKSKNRLNGIFGMCYTDPVRQEILYDPYNPDGLIWREEETDIKKALADTERYSNSFLVYAWGVWTTVHARRHLHNLLRLTGEGTIYWDTDSSKAIDVSHKAISDANAAICTICDERGAYIQTESKRYYLGVYEHETAKGKYRLFKTLGAKKYAYVDHKGELHLTVSGIGKSKSPYLPDGARELGDIANFKPGFVFKESGGITLHYNDEEITKICPPGCKGAPFTCASNVGMENSTYTIGVTGEYAEIIGLNLLDSA